MIFSRILEQRIAYVVMQPAFAAFCQLAVLLSILGCCVYERSLVINLQALDSSSPTT